MATPTTERWSRHFHSATSATPSRPGRSLRQASARRLSAVGVSPRFFSAAASPARSTVCIACRRTEGRKRPNSRRDAAWAVIEAPSNLGLRPPTDDAAPGVSKLSRAHSVTPDYRASWRDRPRRRRGPPPATARRLGMADTSATRGRLRDTHGARRAPGRGAYR